MWKEYSIQFVKKNRASSISIMVAAFISSLFLSFLCSIFYNLWAYDVERIILAEGDWQGRITGEIDEEDLLEIQNFANVEKVVVNEELSGDRGTVADIYFQNPRTIFEDLPLITQRLGLSEEAGSYNILLLSQYLIHDPKDETPPLLLAFYLVVLLALSISLVLIIHNSFAVSMNARVHQFGIFSSIGATPGQIRTCLMQEAAVLCAVPILVGNLFGILLSFTAKRGMELVAANLAGRFDIPFQYHPAIFFLTVAVSALTVLFSAWLPARKLSRLTPLEAIRNTGTLKLKRKRHSRILRLFFGMEGELAGNALKAQKKALRTSSLSLTLSFLGFTTIMCFFSLTDLSRKYTYFEKYQDVWDVMVTVKETKVEDFALTSALQEINGVEDLIVYQKGEARITVPEDNLSPELQALGGPSAVAKAAVSNSGGAWLVKAPVVILDDEAFLKYCEDIGVQPRLDGTVILNQIWDSIHSVFRYREYVPFLTEDRETVTLQNATSLDSSAEIPVIGYTQELPVLKEEYDDYTLVQFIPLTLWKTIGGTIGGVEEDSYVRILAKEDAALTELNELEHRVSSLLSQSYVIESENREEEKIADDAMMRGYKLIMGSFCALLAMIGVANVFSYTAGFLRQRRREFAQYMSVGMTPEDMKKLFCAEALVIAGRPILVTLPFTVLFVEFTAKASYLNPQEVWPEIPIALIICFCLIIVGFVILAYYLGGKRVLKYSLADALRDDTMM